ncbi:hypothetical protein EDD22DRAFT_847906 [Suillus occidentalis]|nr:hypothetical protein EDD22DRAFT_847906 [Suillus occidentalis]
MYIIYHEYKHLIPDAPELMQTFIAAESDGTCKRNTIVLCFSLTVQYQRLSSVLIDNSGNPCLTDFGLATVEGEAELHYILSFLLTDRLRGYAMEGNEITSDLHCAVEKNHTCTHPDNVLDDHWNLVKDCWSWDPGHCLRATKILERIIDDFRINYPQDQQPKNPSQEQMNLTSQISGAFKDLS